jgi:hypothetical protein
MIIAGELDLEVPEINLDDLRLFMLMTKEMHDNSVASNEEKVYLERNNQPYPWQRRLLEVDNKTYWRYKNIPVFKPLLPFIQSLPIDQAHRFVILLYQEQSVEYDFNYHFDNILGVGFRICINLDTSKPFVQLSQLKPDFLNHARARNKIENNMVEGEIYDLVPSKKNTVLFMNGTHFPHRVPVDPIGGPRLVLQVIGTPTTAFNNLKWLQKFEKDVLL